MVTKVKGHALTLNLLGRYLAEAHNGDVPGNALTRQPGLMLEGRAAMLRVIGDVREVAGRRRPCPVHLSSDRKGCREGG